MTSATARRRFVLGVALFLGACQGTIPDQGPSTGGSGEGGTSPGGKPTTSPTGPAVTTPPGGGPPGSMTTGPADAVVAGPRPLRRLTTLELNNTLRDLLGDPSAPVKDKDPNGDWGFAAAPVVSGATAQALLETAEATATKALASLSTLHPCDVKAMGELSCATSFVSTFGRRAFRRPLDKAEADDLVGLYKSARADLAEDHAGGMRVVITAMLQSPFFLYHWQRPAEPAAAKDGVIALDGYELASRLSYFLWSSMPDDRLLSAAEAGTLAKPEGLAAEVARLLKDPNASETMLAFHREWLKLERVGGLVKDTNAFPQWNESLRGSMAEEIQRYIVDWSGAGTATGSGKLEALLASGESFADPALGKVYGIDKLNGTGFQKITYPAGQRAGLFTMAGFVAALSNFNSTNPPRRGYSLLSHFLCGSLPPPPAGAADGFQLRAGQTTRQSFEKHRDTSSTCYGCHATIDPLGFSLENFDAMGGYRTKEYDLPVDASGEMQLGGKKVAFSNIVELAPSLARAPEVRECIARNWMRFALDRGEVSADQASFQAAYKAFESGGFDVRAYLGALAQSRTFTHRAPETAEKLQ